MFQRLWFCRCFPFYGLLVCFFCLKRCSGEPEIKVHYHYQRWSPRGRLWPRGRPWGHILKSLALTSKPQVLENCPVLGSRTALLFELLKFCWNTPETSQKICKDLFLFSWSVNRLKKNFWRPFSPEKKFWRPFFWDCLKKFFENLFIFWEHLLLCSWSLTLASRGSLLGLGLEIFLWPWPRALCPRLHLWSLIPLNVMAD